MPEIDWESALSDIETDSKKRQIERDRLEQSLTKMVNRFDFGDESSIFTNRVTRRAKMLFSLHGHEPDVLSIIEGLLIRSAQKKRELLLWSAVSGLSPQETQRRSDIYQGFDYRRSVLKALHKLLTNEDWPVEHSTAQSIFQEMRQMGQEPILTIFENDYTDQIE